MSVLIRNMKMPKTCEECTFGYEEDVAWMACIPQGVSVRKESVQGICDPHCPLVEVSAPHGDLIDIDSKITIGIKDGLKVTTVRELLNDRAVKTPEDSNQSGGDGMRFVYAMLALTITSGIITIMRISGVVISDDASLISIAIMTAGALAGGD